MREGLLRYALLVRILVLFAALTAAGACDNGDSPTDPSNPPTVTETFTGTLSRNGSQLHTFTATARGTVRATLTSVTPAGSPAVGLSLGTWDPTFEVCSVVLTNNAAIPSSVLQGNIVGITSLCVRIFDSTGNVPADEPIAYTITVERPDGS